MKKTKYAFELDFFADLHKRMPRDVKVATILAQLYTEMGQVDEGLKLDRKLVRLSPDDATAHYNLGCSLALKGRKNDAVKAIRQAVSLGYRDYHWMRNDPDLQQLQDYKPFGELIQELEVG
jgi:Flp pilus assembly protein TadD